MKKNFVLLFLRVVRIFFWSEHYVSSLVSLSELGRWGRDLPGPTRNIVYDARVCLAEYTLHYTTLFELLSSGEKILWFSVTCFDGSVLSIKY